VLLVRRDIICKLVLWTLTPYKVMLLEMMLVAILFAIYKQYPEIQFPTPEVAISTEKVVISALGTGILYKEDMLEYLCEYFFHHLSVCLPLLIQPALRNIAVLDSKRQHSDDYDAVCCWHLVDLGRCIANCHIYR
jgi:hypothetical protein